MLHVRGGYGIAVREPRTVVEAESDGELVRGELQVFRQQAVDRERLVFALYHQRFEHEIGQRARRRALQRVRIELVETAKRGEKQLAAFGRRRIDVIEVGVVRRILGRRPQREAVCGMRRERGAEKCGADKTVNREP